LRQAPFGLPLFFVRLKHEKNLAQRQQHASLNRRHEQWRFHNRFESA
jgi:hypothetical protein